jgi:serine/threonine protein kinase
MSLIDDLIDRWEEANEQGTVLSAEQLCADHPELLVEVRRQLRALVAVEKFLESELGDSNVLKPELSQYCPPESLSLTGNFRLERLHASGGLGQVYLAHDTTLGRVVAIKFPKRSGMTQEQLARFEREAHITGQLEHPGIVPIHALRFDPLNEPCYVMRFIDGTTLQERVTTLLSRYRTVKGISAELYRSDEFRHLLQSMVALGNIVAYAHGRGFIHRDIKPANLMLGPFGETLLLDWGIAKQLSPNAVTTCVASDEHNGSIIGDAPAPMSPRQRIVESPLFTSDGQTLGTPAYASPEQLFGRHTDVGPASDIFSLGTTLFFVMSGTTPIERLGWNKFLKEMERSEANLADLLPRNVPKELRAICQKAMNILPKQRYESASLWVQDLDSYLAREPISVVRDPWTLKLLRSARKRPVIAGASLAIFPMIVLLLAIASTLVSQNNRKLSYGNQKLQIALADVERSNELAMDTLRTLFDKSVVGRFAERRMLADEDRSFLYTALQQYLAFADIQHRSEKSRAIRAEAHFQIGEIFSTLSQIPDAEHHIGQSILLFKELVDDYDRREYRQSLVSCYAILAEMLSEQERFDEALTAANQGSELNVPLVAQGSDEESLEAKDNLASLYSIQASCLQSKGEWNKTIDALDRARVILEELLTIDPKNQFRMNALGGVYRALGTALARDSKMGIRSELELRYAKRAVDLLTELNESYPKVAKYRYSLAWAHCDLSFSIENEKDYWPAIEEVWKAIRTMEQLKERYPLIDLYQVSLRSMLLRRARLYQLHDDILAAAGDIRSLDSTFQLSLADFDVCFDILNRVNKEFPNLTEYQECMADLQYRRSKLYEANGELVQAKNELESSLLQCRSQYQRLPRHSQSAIRLFYRLLDLSRIHAKLGEDKLAITVYDDACTVAGRVHSPTQEQREEFRKVLIEHRDFLKAM